MFNTFSFIVLETIVGKGQCKFADFYVVLNKSLIGYFQISFSLPLTNKLWRRCKLKKKIKIF
jgi:hypothetical protein